MAKVAQEEAQESPRGSPWERAHARRNPTTRTARQEEEHQNPSHVDALHRAAASQRDEVVRSSSRDGRGATITGVGDRDGALQSQFAQLLRADVFARYVRRRGDEAQQFYAREIYRERARSRKIRKQQGLAHFVERIWAMREDGKQIMLAHGAWGTVAGRPGTACNKGRPPCPGVMLMRELAKYFPVVLVPERNTSKTCSYCGFVGCKSVSEVDATLREEKMGAATSPQEVYRASRCELRSLRRCHNASCRKVLNRDRNAAVNIGRRLHDYLLPDDEAARDGAGSCYGYFFAFPDP
ncbi:hypothetical protein AB1Y20_014374 [Prymnesium parvum]|uniref:Cas12f1-like TNB domain-containing protein n=1 Tax=Prymnesium parvum TaxID=97485 RepID=A0AB34IDI1_PRYPA